MKKPDKKRLQTRQTETLRQRALARWDAEGGAEAVPAPPADDVGEVGSGVSATAGPSPGSQPAAPWSDAECQQLHARLIALENLVISLLAMGNKRQLALARDMASHIVARTGSTPHRLTEQAARQMTHVVGRAKWFRDQA